MPCTAIVDSTSMDSYQIRTCNTMKSWAIEAAPEPHLRPGVSTCRCEDTRERERERQRERERGRQIERERQTSMNICTGSLISKKPQTQIIHPSILLGSPPGTWRGVPLRLHLPEARTFKWRAMLFEVYPDPKSRSNHGRVFSVPMNTTYP